MAIRFVAYIDESGDTGLENVKPSNSAAGATEWLILSCFVVKIENDHKCLGWVREIKSKFTNVNSEFLHYKDLIPAKKKIACETINEKACRFFVVVSNKKNIEGWKNQAAEFVSGKELRGSIGGLRDCSLSESLAFARTAFPHRNGGGQKFNSFSPVAADFAMSIFGTI
ncbi:MAG: hypothetical protein WDM91_07750 [Rhizomicrobium sp.]